MSSQRARKPTTPARNMRNPSPAHLGFFGTMYPTKMINPHMMAVTQYTMVRILAHFCGVWLKKARMLNCAVMNIREDERRMAMNGFS